MKRKYSTQRQDAIRTIPKASNYIAHVDNLEPGPIVAFCRESIPRNEGHLDDQELNLRSLERRGFNVIGVFKPLGSADAEDRVKLEIAAFKAKQAKAVLVAESTDRYVLGFRYGHHKPRRPVPPNVIEFERFLDLVHGAKIATLWHPDLSEKEVRRLQSNRGQKGNRGGRPAVPLTRKRRRELKAPVAVKLRQDGLSWRQIGKALNVPWRTSKDWGVKMLANPHGLHQ